MRGLYDVEISKELKEFTSKESLIQFRTAIQSGIATYMDKVRYHSTDEIIPNRTGTRNPYQARRLQKSTPGKITERTGRLNRMINEGGKQFGKNWEGFGNKKMNTDRGKMKSFHGTIHEKNYQYSAWWSAYVRDGSAGLLNYKGKLSVADLKKSLAIRAGHEKGLKGGGARPYLRPTADRFNLQDELRPHVRKWLGRF